MAQSKFVPYELKTSIIRITTYEGTNLKGVIINPYFENEVPFEGTIQFLKIIDELQDAINFPQKSMSTRKFGDDANHAHVLPQTSGAAQPSSEERAIASFKLSILFRHNASWQGSVIWLDKGMQSEFRSALELIFLIDSVLGESV
jgi:hypothetical protein